MTRATPDVAPRRPNLVYTLADDMGWGEVGSDRAEIRTPRINSIAAAGGRLESFYVQTVCSHMRAALVTGLYPMPMRPQVGVIWPWATYGFPLAERAPWMFVLNGQSGSPSRGRARTASTSGRPRPRRRRTVRP